MLHELLTSHREELIQRCRQRVGKRYAPSHTMEVVDHGAGQTPSEANGSGSGLRGLRERVAIVGGELAVRRTEEGGFAVTASLPYRAA